MEVKGLILTITIDNVPNFKIEFLLSETENYHVYVELGILNEVIVSPAVQPIDLVGFYKFPYDFFVYSPNIPIVGAEINHFVNYYPFQDR